ncbi:FGGY-family carbohydrate kinase [Pannonibacter phragmitetus]|uniref:FGGY-family carbohydrate kinase n=1 Tax=Pannonibacter phragmitetus TaxID=121719 RepID=UPI003D2EDE10
MASLRNIAVIDIGKTNAKVAVVDIARRQELGVRRQPNRVRTDGPYPHFDVEGLWSFFLESLKELAAEHRIDGISVTTHGASAVLLDASGKLATPVLDYEFTGPDDLASQYDALRPGFAQTGSPRLSMGLNLGAQLHWLLETQEGLRERTAQVLTYPQYWTYRLTGVAACEVTSLGCHTDLWNPFEGVFSPLVSRLGLEGRMAPVRKAGDVLGPLLLDVADRAGLPEGIPVACGIHDSNASLYPHLLARQGAFSVVSTGTWVISLSVGAAARNLDPARDTLVNVNALGGAVPSARFMGGREFDLMLEGHDRTSTDADVRQVLDRSILLLPAVEPRSGPFQGRTHRWSVEDEAGLSDGQHYAAVSFYLALVTAECLAMTGGQGPVIVEGPFAANRLYLSMLEAASARKIQVGDGSVTGTSIGAALLLAGFDGRGGEGAAQDDASVIPDAAFAAYAAAWRQAVAEG